MAASVVAGRRRVAPSALGRRALFVLVLVFVTLSPLARGESTGNENDLVHTSGEGVGPRHAVDAATEARGDPAAASSSSPCSAARPCS